MTNIENLMQPRYKVMMDYPDSVYEVGIIIKFPEKSDWFTGEMDWCSEMVGRNGSKAMRSIKYFEPYPLIFKPLPWYADRDVSELPEYVVWDEDVDGKHHHEVFKIKSWYIGKTVVHANITETQIIEMCEFFKPTTLEQYNEYTSNQSKK